MEEKFRTQHRSAANSYVEGISELVLLKCYMACRCGLLVSLWWVWQTLQ